MNNLATYLPSAGKATRLRGIPKFYLPIGENSNLINYHIENLNNIKNNKIIIGTNDVNFPSLNASYNKEKVIKIQSDSMVETVYKTLDYERDLHLVIMPDTYFDDYEIVNQKISKINKSNFDVILGLWNIRKDQYGKLGQCKLNKDNVEVIIDKDPKCIEPLAWGTILWNNNFIQYIQPSDAHFGISINRALDNGINVGYVISDSQYFDCGTFYEYKNLINGINEN